MKKIFVLPILLILMSCTPMGGGGMAGLVSELAVDSNPDDGMVESGCFFGEYVGTWTKSRITYTKIVHPEGTEPPDC